MTFDRKPPYKAESTNLGTRAPSRVVNGAAHANAVDVVTGAVERLRVDAADAWKAKVGTTVLQLAGRKTLITRPQPHRRTSPAPANETLGAARAFAGHGSSRVPKPAGSPEDSLPSITAQHVLTTAFGGSLPRGVSWAEFAESVEAEKRKIEVKTSLFNTDVWRNILEYMDPVRDEIAAANPAFRSFCKKRLPARRGGRVLRNTCVCDTINLFFVRDTAFLRFAPSGDLIFVDPLTIEAKEHPSRLRSRGVTPRECGPGTIGAEQWNPGLGVQTSDLPPAYANRLKKAFRVECSLANNIIALVTPGPGKTSSFQIELWNPVGEPERALHVLRLSNNEKPVERLELSPDGAFLVASGTGPDFRGHEIIEWELKTGQQRSFRREPCDELCTFLDSGALVALTQPSGSSEVRVVDVRSGAPLRSLPAMQNFSRPALKDRGETLVDPPIVVGEWVAIMVARRTDVRLTANLVCLTSGAVRSFPAGMAGSDTLSRSMLVARASRDRARIAVGFGDRIWVADMRCSESRIREYTIDGSIVSIDWSLRDTHIATLTTASKVSILQVDS